VHKGRDGAIADGQRSHRTSIESFYLGEVTGCVADYVIKRINKLRR
jgi:hypothetical protein